MFVKTTLQKPKNGYIHSVHRVDDQQTVDTQYVFDC